MSTAQPNGFQQWQLLWGSPRNIFPGADGWRMEVALTFALILHGVPFGFLWHKKATQPPPEVVTLQNVDLIEPEIEAPPPPPVVVEKPKSALDFIKMALPVFRKPPEIQAPRDIVIPKAAEPKLADPEKLAMDKKLLAPPAPEIKLDKNAPNAPKIADIAKIPQTRAAVPRGLDPALKLEEVGRKAVAPPPQGPAISLDKSGRERAADVSAMPQIARAVPSAQTAGRLVEKTAPQAYKPPAKVFGYQTQAPSVNLEQPRDVARPTAKPVVAPIAPKPKAAAESLQISKEKVKITGPLAGRKVVKSFVPGYPAWAKARNVEADVSIRFYVSPTGDVLPNAVVERTSGYPELDRLAMDALKKWVFTPLSSSNQEQWGVITFRYLLD